MSSMSFSVRDVVPSDYAQWRSLFDGYMAFYGRSGAQALPESVIEATWQRFFDPDEPMHSLVAESEGRLLGLAHFLFHRSTWEIDPVCYLEDLFTAPQARGRGVARGLIMELSRRATLLGATKVYWLTQASNDRAMHLYDKVATRTGFVVYARRS